MDEKEQVMTESQRNEVFLQSQTVRETTFREWLDGKDIEVPDATLLQEMNTKINTNVENINTLKTHNHDTVYAKIGHNHDSSYATKSHNHDTSYSKIGHTHETLHTHENISVLDVITTEKVEQWNNKSTFSGDYNDLTNKPNIPSIVGLATESFVDAKIKTIDSELDAINEQLTLVDEMKSYINIKEYGAKGDGQTDDSKAIKTALKKAYTDGGINLYFPDGDYIFNGYADIYSNTKIIFGKNARVIKGDNATTSYLFVCGRLENEGTVGYGGGAKNVEIIGGTFIGNPNTLKGTGITFNHMQNFKATGCKFVNGISTGHIFDLAGCKDIVIENCTFQGWIPQSGRGYTEAIQIDNSTSPSLSDKFSNYDNLPTCNVMVRNCSFIPTYDDNGHIKYPAPNPIGSHGFVPTHKFKNIKFYDNYIEGNTGFETTQHSGGTIRFYAVDGVHIKGNTFKDLNSSDNYVIAIEAKLHTTDNVSEKVSNVVIEGNTFIGYNYTKESSRSLIRIYGLADDYVTNVRILNNNFLNCRDMSVSSSSNVARDIISLSYTSGVKIDGNVLNEARRLCYFTYVSNISITNNSVTKAMYMPISFNQSSNVIISDNIFNDCNHALYSSENSGVQIINNIFRNTIEELVSLHTGLVLLKTCVGLVFHGNQIIKDKNVASKVSRVVYSYTNGKNQVFANNVVSGYGEVKNIDVNSGFAQTINVDTISQTNF